VRHHRANKPTDGLVRGMKATDLGEQGYGSGRQGKTTGPRAERHRPTRGQNGSREYSEAHADSSHLAPTFDEQSTELQMFETGIKVIDLLEPYLKGRKDRPIRRRGGVGKDGVIQEADLQPRHQARRACRYCRRSARRTREGNDLWTEFQEAGVIDPHDFTKSKCGPDLRPE